MNYQPFLIAGFATGFDREVQPWLLPQDAFTELLDGYVYRGVLNKRNGYQGFATGLRSTPTESRMVHGTTFGYTVTGTIDGTNKIFTIQANPPIVPHSLTITGSSPAITVTDNGSGALAGSGTGTVNYATGAIAVTFTTAPAASSTITVAYGNFSIGTGGVTYGPITLANTPLQRGTVVITAGAQTATDNGLGGFIAPNSGLVNYTTGQVTVIFSAPVTSGVPIDITYASHQGLPVMGIMNFYPTTNIRQLIVADTTYVNVYNPATDTLQDITTTKYHGLNTDFWSWVNYQDASSDPRLLFCNGNVSDVIQKWDGTMVAAYSPTLTIGMSNATLNARQMFVYKGRLILFQTIENGTLYPRRIRISGFGSNCDVFDDTAPGAGLINIPDTTWYFGAAFNRDDIIFFVENATWTMKYTGNDVDPFDIFKLDSSRGCSAAFAPISYLNQTIAVSPPGLIVCDGYQVDRTDNNIPDYTFENIDNTQANFQKCFSGFVDQDRDVYILHPSKGVIKPSSVPAGSSDRILVINFEEDNFAVYRLPMSCMGNFQVVQALLWSDLTPANGFPDWASLAAKYQTWADFPFTKGSPIPIGGGHKGEIWELNADGSQDNPLHIRGISASGSSVTVTTDWNNYSVGDIIFFTGILGMTGINGVQATIDSVTDNNNFVVNFDSSPGGTYTANSGMASRVIPFEATGKKLNPYINIDKKVMCGWMYFYVNVAETTLLQPDGITPVPAMLRVDVLTNNNEGTDFSKPTFTYYVDCSAINGQKGNKKWVKIWINQVAQFLQYKVSNAQAGTHVQVHGTMCGFMPTGRLI